MQPTSVSERVSGATREAATPSRCRQCGKQGLEGYECLFCDGFVCALCATEAESEFQCCSEHLERAALRAYHARTMELHNEALRLRRVLGIVERIRTLAAPQGSPRGLLALGERMSRQLDSIHGAAGEAAGLLAAGRDPESIPEPGAARLWPYLKGWADALRYGEVTLLWLVVCLAGLAGFLLMRKV